MDELSLARVRDPGRGFFCATTKKGAPLPAPPDRRPPLVDREKNPKGVHHPFKSFEDRQEIKDRRRYQEWCKRLGQKP